MRAFTVAAVQIAPSPAPLTPDTVAANCAKAAQWLRRCVEASAAELVVLPETASTGFVTGTSPEELWDVVSRIPGPVTEPIQEAARDLGVHVVWGTYERGERRGVVHNAAALIGPDGEILGVYRKTHPFAGERCDRGGWVTAGDEVCVVDTELGRDRNDHLLRRRLPRTLTDHGRPRAELIARPSALLRSADLWELTNRARAYDNHVYIVGANATGIDPGGTIYFGNSMVVTPIADVVARAASHEGWVAARLDPERAMASLTPGSNIAQSFDHLADRNLDLIRRYADDLQAPAKTSFPH